MSIIQTLTDHDPAPRSRPLPGQHGEDYLAVVMATLETNKAEDVVTIDLRGKTSIADHMVICSATSSRAVAAIAGHIEMKLKEHGCTWLKIEGLPQADWVLIDAGDVIVHLFRPEVREFYNIEKMWGVAGPVRPVSADA